MNVPEKWKKYEMLIRYGLATEEEINNQINRYSKNDIDKICNDIKGVLNTEEYAFIIKLVPHELKPKLKNFIIRDMIDIERFKQEAQCFHGHHEIWWCKTKVSEGKAPHGRMYIDNNDVSQCVEQIWADTARKIELIGTGIPYIVGERLSWGFSYGISAYRVGEIEIAVFRNVLRQLERKRAAIQLFVDDLQRIGVSCLSIEYKVVNDQIRIVDWDSSDDRTVLRLL